MLDIVTFNLCLPLSLVVGVNVAHDTPLDRQQLFVIIATSIVMLFLSVAFSFLVQYVGALNKRVSAVTHANLNLLNGMHEGLLIASPGDDRSPI